MSVSLSRIVVAAIALALVAALPGAVQAATDIGKATAIKTSVTGTLDSRSIVLKTGDEIFAKQTVTTDGAGVGQFEFRDKTRLAIGPGSTVVLDDFVYNPKGSGSKVVLELARGSFRFITGKANHDAYEIATPAATIGVRGTAFDVYVGDTGALAIAMINGAVDVCPRGGACRPHNIVGRFLHHERRRRLLAARQLGRDVLQGHRDERGVALHRRSATASAGAARPDKNCRALCRRRGGDGLQDDRAPRDPQTEAPEAEAAEALQVSSAGALRGRREAMADRNAFKRHAQR